MIVFLSLVLVVVVVMARRRRRARLLAGLVSTRPTFTVEPPRRHLGSLKRERL